MDESRKQLEEWVTVFYGWHGSVKRSLGDNSRYDIEEVHNYWQAWQASREAMNEK